MKRFILSLVVAVGLISAASALAGSIPVDQYSELIVGKWKNKYGVVNIINSNGSCGTNGSGSFYKVEGNLFKLKTPYSTQYDGGCIIYFQTKNRYTTSDETGKCTWLRLQSKSDLSVPSNSVSANSINKTLTSTDYSKLIIGSWEAGKYSFTFSPNGTYSRVTGLVESDSNNTEGTWKIIGDSLILDHSNLPIKIHFKDNNNFTWETPMLHWDVSRENPQ